MKSYNVIPNTDVLEGHRKKRVKKNEEKSGNGIVTECKLKSKRRDRLERIRKLDKKNSAVVMLIIAEAIKTIFSFIRKLIIN